METDVLEVEGSIVTIVRMGARATVARTRDDEELIIPNSILVQSTVRNLTLTDQLFRLRTNVGVSYGSDMHRVEEVLTKAAFGLEGRADYWPKPATEAISILPVGKGTWKPPGFVVAD